MRRMLANKERIMGFGHRVYMKKMDPRALLMKEALANLSGTHEFHAQTAVECAFRLHEQVRDRLDDIARIELTTHESAIRIIDKKGPLYNTADRDHCLQYMVAIGLLFGDLTAVHYEDGIASDSRIDAIREKIIVSEDSQYSRDYLDPDKRSIANAVKVIFHDGEATEKVVCEYPIGHRERRAEGIPKLIAKFENAVATRFPKKQSQEMIRLFADAERLDAMKVHHFMEALTF